MCVRAEGQKPTRSLKTPLIQVEEVEARDALLLLLLLEFSPV